jgi:hypothetical protein
MRKWKIRLYKNFEIEVDAEGEDEEDARFNAEDLTEFDPELWSPTYEDSEILYAFDEEKVSE